MKVSELSAGSQVHAPLLVRDARVRRRSAGGELLTLTLADRSATVTGVVTEGVGEAHAVCRPGTVVRVTGVVADDERFGRQLLIEQVAPAGEGEYDLDDLVDGPCRPAELLEQELRELVSTVQRPHLRRLLEELLGEGTDTWAQFRDAPAAKHYHQAYRHGLLEHSVTVAQAASAISATFADIDRDLAVTGAILHDIGKLEAYEQTGALIEMSDAGRLFGEIPLGYYRIRRAIEGLEGFPDADAQALLHIILSHHGSLEHGSPVVPATREAALVHGIDTLGARLGSFDRVEKGLASGQRWSGYDKGLGGGAYFGTVLRPAA